MSWLLVACVPGLLILVSLGLGRLERELTNDTVTASDVAEFLRHAQPADVQTLATKGMPEALDYLHRRQARQLSEALTSRPQVAKQHPTPLFAITIGDLAEAGLPTRIHVPSRINPQLTGTRHANRV